MRARLALLPLLLTGSYEASALLESSEATVGDVRVQALSPTLLRIEPKGPGGFEDRTTFMVVNRSFAGIPIEKVDSTDGFVHLKTASYTVLLRANSGGRPTCDSPRTSTDADGAVRTAKYPKGAKAADRGACCKLCEEDAQCAGWVYAPGSKDCWPLSSFGGLRKTSRPDREVGCNVEGLCGSDVSPEFRVVDSAGSVMYDSAADARPDKILLHWPAPLQSTSYSLVDFPRFFVPEWAVAPIPSSARVDPALAATHGYDFRNNVNGDTYVFLFGKSLAQWSASRGEFLRLAGPVPLLPDYAYGTWFTYWHSYTETEAKQDIARWESDKLPIDIWALDMNWRDTDHGKDHYYEYPNTKLFPNFTEWFEYLKAHRLRTYFNDHPFPVASRGEGGLQTSPEETAFRWKGLSEWMARGLTFWWFDHNWGFSIPPPFVNTSGTDGTWFGLDNAAWGSHVYFSSVADFDKNVRDPAGDTFNGGRPMTLTKFGKPDWRSGMDPKGHAESPAQHRYPVWWTGDGVDLKASVESMVDAGLYDLKPFVHSDCGGDSRLNAGSLLRWIPHCVFGSVLRLHGADHRPWTYGPAVEATIRSYFNMRYKMLPSLIAAGHQATLTGFPLAARCDLLWPEHAPESSTNRQYLFLGEVLVAPIYDFVFNMSSRSVWIPPGDWQDVWDGSIVTGPKTITTRQPYERQPMWHRRDGGLMVLADAPATRVEEQDWSTLTVEAFPATAQKSTRRSLFERGSSRRTDLSLETDGKGKVRLSVAPSEAAASRAWAARFHLRPGQRAAAATLDGEPLPLGALHIEAVSSGIGFLPFGGAGAAPAAAAGPVAEVRIPAGTHARVVELEISDYDMLVI